MLLFLLVFPEQNRFPVPLPGSDFCVRLHKLQAPSFMVGPLYELLMETSFKSSLAMLSANTPSLPCLTMPATNETPYLADVQQ
jgi:hypothetical protein